MPPTPGMGELQPEPSQQKLHGSQCPLLLCRLGCSGVGRAGSLQNRTPAGRRSAPPHAGPLWPARAMLLSESWTLRCRSGAADQARRSAQALLSETVLPAGLAVYSSSPSGCASCCLMASRKASSLASFFWFRASYSNLFLMIRCTMRSVVRLLPLSI